MIKQEFLKIARRRGMFYTAVILTSVIAIAVLVISLIVRAKNPGNYEGGQLLLASEKNVIILLGVVFSILMGAQAGAWDDANGTFRYMAMTGKPRLKLFLTRIPGLISAILVFLAPAFVIGLITAFALPLDGSPKIDGGAVADYFWEPILLCLVFSLISMGIGAVLRSSGAGIAVALVLNLVGLNLLAILGELNETLGDVMLPVALDRISGGTDSSISVGVSALLVVAWVALFVGAGLARTLRAEY